MSICLIDGDVVDFLVVIVVVLIRMLLIGINGKL